MKYPTSDSYGGLGCWKWKELPEALLAPQPVPCPQGHAGRWLPRGAEARGGPRRAPVGPGTPSPGTGGAGRGVRRPFPPLPSTGERLRRGPLSREYGKHVRITCGRLPPAEARGPAEGGAGRDSALRAPPERGRFKRPPGAAASLRPARRRACPRRGRAGSSGTMGLCYSLRSRLAAAHPSAPYGGRGEVDIPSSAAAGEHGDPQVRHRLRQDLVAKERADKKRSKSIDKTLKAEKREYKQTHRLLLLGECGRERGGSARQVRGGPEAAVSAGARRPRVRAVGGGRGWAGLGPRSRVRGGCPWGSWRGVPLGSRRCGGAVPGGGCSCRCGRSLWQPEGSDIPPHLS